MKSPTTSARDVAATERTHVNARIGQAVECVAPRRVEDAVTRCGAGIRPALTGYTPMCTGMKTRKSVKACWSNADITMNYIFIKLVEIRTNFYCRH